MTTALFFDIFGRDKGVGKMLDNVGDKAQGLGTKMGGAASGAAKLLAPLTAIVSTAAIAKFGTESVRVFSNLEDATGAAGVVFGDSMKRITEQAAGAAQSLGMTRTQVIEAANTFGTFGKSAGLAGDDLALFSTDMTKLAGDMASFKGKSPEEAIQAIGSALRGESEPIRSFGVLLDDATLRARALSMGLISTTKEALTPQIKVLAAQKEILAQTTDAQGDFARTQDSTANVSKRLSAETENLQAKIGSVLAPAFTNARLSSLGFVQSVSGFVDRVGPGLQTILGQLGPSLKGVSDILFKGDFSGGIFGLAEDSPVIDMLFTIREGFVAVGDAVKPVLPEFRALAPSILTLVSAFSPLSLVFKAIAPVLPDLAKSAAELAGVLAGVLSEVMEALAPLISEVIKQVAGLLSWFTNLKGSSQALTLGIGVFVAALAAYHAIVGIVSIATKAWIAVQGALNFVLNMNPIGIVVIAISALVAAVVLAYNNVGWFKDGVDAAWNGIQTAIRVVVEWFTGTIQPAFSRSLDQIKGFFDDTVRNIGRLWSGLESLAKAPISFIINTVINDGLIGAFNTVAGWIPGVTRLNPIRIAGFDAGGYTGDGDKMEPAGLVHKGEFVFTKEETRKAGVGTFQKIVRILRNGYADGGFVNPVEGGGTISQGYSGLNGHNGIDIAGPLNTKIMAAFDGNVTSAGWSTMGGGNEIHIRHAGGWETWYAHLNRILVRVGQVVNRAALIGLMGSTGNSTGSHLHYMVLKGGWPNVVDPSPYMAGKVPAGAIDPIAAIIDGLIGSFRGAFAGGGMLAEIAIGIGRKLAGDMGNALMGGTGSTFGPKTFDQGGWMDSMGVNRTGRPEAVLTPSQSEDFHRLATSGGGVTIEQHNHYAPGLSEAQVADMSVKGIVFELRGKGL